MHIPSISSSLLALATLTLAGISPVSALVIDINFNAEAPLAPVTPFDPQNPFQVLASCGYPSGNCYENDCNGQNGNHQTTCSSGPYNGCPCGYGCGKNVGSCFSNGCDGKADPDFNGRPRCTNKFQGCDCNL